MHLIIFVFWAKIYLYSVLHVIQCVVQHVNHLPSPPLRAPSQLRNLCPNCSGDSFVSKEVTTLFSMAVSPPYKGLSRQTQTQIQRSSTMFSTIVSPRHMDFLWSWIGISSWNLHWPETKGLTMAMEWDTLWSCGNSSYCFGSKITFF